MSFYGFIAYTNDKKKRNGSGEKVVTIETYIKKDKIIKKEKKKKMETEFPYVKCEHEDCFQYVKDFNYVEGAIIITCDGTNILDFEHGDSVDEIWIDLLNSVYQILEGEKDVYFYFPDQPLIFRIQEIPNYRSHLLICVGEQRTCVNRQEYILAIIKGAEQFFSLGIKSCSGHLVATSYIELEVVNKLKKMIKQQE